jgi:phosphate-selective porin
MKRGRTMMEKTEKKLLAMTALTLLAALFMAVPAPAEEGKDSPLVTAAKSLKLSGYAQFLAVDWDKDVDSFSLRRARLTLTGDIVKNLRFKITVDFVKSPALLDALVEFEPSKAIGLRFGQFLVPFSLESVTPTRDLDMVNRAAVVDTLVPGRDNGSSGRDIGAALYGSFSILDYTLGLFNGSGINKADTDSHKDLAGRIVLHPFKALSVGGSLYLGKLSPSPQVPLVRRNREGLEAALLISRFMLKSEYIHAEDALVSKAGWYVLGGFFAIPGRLQALARYDSLDLDRAVPDNGKNVISMGLNWFIMGQTKLQVNYEIHRLETGVREKSGVLAQFQAAF